MYQVLKRDGETAEFNISKIAVAITKAFEAQNKQYHSSVIDLLALKVTADFESKIKNDLISVKVRCVVENTGKRDGEEVAQCYLGRPEYVPEGIQSVPKMLVDFRRVAVKAGEKVPVEFKIDERYLRYFKA